METLPTTPIFSENDIARFLKNVYPEPNTGCWLWAGYIRDNNRGSILVNRKWIICSRFSFMIHNGEIPNGLFVCHSCDNPFCVSPDHLFLGTPKDNTHDMIQKNRKFLPKGTLHPNCSLAETDVIEIRNEAANGVVQRRLSEKYNVSYQMISRIILRKAWKHI